MSQKLCEECKEDLYYLMGRTRTKADHCHHKEKKECWICAETAVNITTWTLALKNKERAVSIPIIPKFCPECGRKMLDITQLPPLQPLGVLKMRHSRK